MLRILDASSPVKPAACGKTESARGRPPASSRQCRIPRCGCYTLCVRRLIVNADDFGLTAGVNRAIVETHIGGVVSSATLMANGARFEDAVTAARSAPNLSVGCHVVLVDGTPVSPPGALDTLVAIRSAEPDKFYSSLSAFAARAMLGGFDRDQLVAEITAQIRKIQATGLRVTHLDTHKHAHIFPEILTALLRAARICGVRAIRNPIVPVKALPARLFKGKPHLWKRCGQVRVLHTFSGQFHQRTKSAGLVTPDGVVGVIETGSVGISLLRQTLANLPEGTWELVCHPGYNDADLRAAHTRLLDAREEERRLLTSEELRQFLDEQKIQVISYREFVETLTENRP
jgi:chitin disaccharide deacetylase